MTGFYDQFFAEPMAERHRIAEAAGLSLAYIHKHTYVQRRNPRFHFHNAVGLDRASNGKLCIIDITEGEIDWAYVLERLKTLQRAGRVPRIPFKAVPSAQFEAFWQLYPLKAHKAKALRLWHKLRCDEASELIMSHLRGCMASEGWRRSSGRYIPHPSTFLVDRGWEQVLPPEERPE